MHQLFQRDSSQIHHIFITPFLQGKARDCANEVRLRGHEVDTAIGNPAPPLQVDEAVLADAKWFNKRWLLAFHQGELEASVQL